MKRNALLTLITVLLVLCGCRQGNNTSLTFNKDIYTPQYATGFKILGAPNKASTMIQVTNPWQGAEKTVLHYLVSRNGEQTPANFNGQVIKADAQRIVCMSSSYIAMLDAIGEVERVIAVSGLDYVSNPYIVAHKDSIYDVGPQPDFESLLALRPDVVLLYGITDSQSALTGKLKELNIPYMFVGEYLEESPLGKAEWMIALSELTDTREKAVKLFSRIPLQYESLKALVDTIGQKPTVMFNAPWNDSWIMPSSQSYMVKLINDAGADYVYPEQSSNRSMPIGLETAYTLIQQADYWLHPGNANTLEELTRMNPKFAHAKSVKQHTVYNNNLRSTPFGGNDFWESATVQPHIVLRDLISIFHPAVISDTLFYYKRLE